MATAVAVAAGDCMVAAGDSAADISGSNDRVLRTRSASNGETGLSGPRAYELGPVDAAGVGLTAGVAGCRVGPLAGFSEETWLKICSSGSRRWAWTILS